VIASDIPPHFEAVVHGCTGLLVPAENPSALAAAIDSLAHDPARRRSLGAAARRRIQAEFLVERYVSAFDDLYTTLLARPAREFGWLKGTTWPPVYWSWIRETIRRRLVDANGS
jgi:hypothetical protein